MTDAKDTGTAVKKLRLIASRTETRRWSVVHVGEIIDNSTYQDFVITQINGEPVTVCVRCHLILRGKERRKVRHMPTHRGVVCLTCASALRGLAKITVGTPRGATHG